MRSRHKFERVVWFAPLAFLAAILGGAGVALAAPTSLLGWTLIVLCTAPILWVLVSALWPPRAERTCPACGGVRLQRLDPRTTYGLSCPDCGWKDESASSWLLAEEEGPLEHMVLAQRGRIPPVDSPRRPG